MVMVRRVGDLIGLFLLGIKVVCFGGFFYWLGLFL